MKYLLIVERRDTGSSKLLFPNYGSIHNRLACFFKGERLRTMRRILRDGGQIEDQTKYRRIVVEPVDDLRQDNHKSLAELEEMG